MYGILIVALIEYTKRVHGELVWLKVREKAKITNHSFSLQQQYSETLFLKLCKHVGETISNLKLKVLQNAFS
jgi:hypothetical protein